MPGHPPPVIDGAVALYTLASMAVTGFILWYLVGKSAGLIELGAPSISRGFIAKRKGNQWTKPSKIEPGARPTLRVQEARANSQTNFEELKKEAQELRHRGRMWRDEEFPAGDESLFQDADNPPRDWLRDGERGKPIHDAIVSWKSPEDFCKTRRPTGKNAKGDATWLYADVNDDHVASVLDLDANKICQGSLGDCYLLSALAAATQSLLIADDLIDEEFEDVGIYGVSFWVQGRWEMVWVDNEFPCYRPKKSSHSGRWRLVFASCEDPNEIWPIVVEKAYAKLHGSYEALSGGQISKALAMLTGGSAAKLNLQSPWCSADRVFKVVKDAEADAKEGSRFIGAGSKGFMQESFANGIVTGHAYTVQAACEAAGKRLLKLRNPWNRSEWKGDWSDGSNIWSSETGRTLDKAIGNRISGDDGEFWMSLDDFMQRFQTLEFCDLKIEGRDARMKALKQAATGNLDKGSGSHADKQAQAPTDDRDIDDLLAFIEDDAPPPRRSKKHKKH
eukprot:TRINITY_DN38384_c0_g1_i1.p1 TRINITY_DN38384_c0_g1~~TRINITY_DN38384_c0_g1_i1.p1  ORF type:complete len:505 (-),score=102.91 TRINITY_DN38384_c0_g1_i1:299-1813(-)